MPQTKKIKVREAWEALNKNGFEHLREEWFSHEENGLIVGGCALGQMALNLGAIPYNVGAYDRYLEPVGISGSECNLNGQLNRFKNVSDKWAVPKSEELHGLYDPKGCGSAIIYWNDASVETTNEAGEPSYRYALTTYREVSDMAREILEPYFDEEIELVEYDYQVSPVGAEST